MDYYRQIRMAHLQRPMGTLFGPKRNRFPTSSIPPIPRSDCAPPPVHDRSAGEELDSSPASLPVPPSHGGQTADKSPQVREQVKQLQFWLKVFARFCHDDADEE